MGSMQKYFTYKCLLMCGIPKVILEGDLEDWQKLKGKVDYLKGFKDTPIAEWAVLLDYVIDKFISAYQGEIDNDFWQRAVSSECYGSGGQRGYSGWFAIFAPFGTSGAYMLNDYNTAISTHKFVHSMYESSDFSVSVIGVPVKVIDHPNHEGGMVYKTKFYAGSNMIHFDEKNNTVRPSKGWGILLLEPPVYEQTSDADRELYEKEWTLSKEKLKAGKVNTPRTASELK